MRSIRLIALLAAAGCGDNGSATPPIDGHPRTDAAVDMAVDQPIDEPTTTGPTNLTNLTPAANVVMRADFTTPLFFKPDGSAVAVVANYKSVDNAATRMDPYVVQLDGSGFKRLNNATACGTCDSSLLAWTADGSALFDMGDIATNNIVGVFKLDPTMEDQTAVAAAQPPAAGDVFNMFTVDSGGGTTRVWAAGDWLTDARNQAGGFDSAGALPFNTANPPPSIVPAGALPALLSGSNATSNVFDARGGKIAFIADATVPTRFDLVVADADGSNPITVITGGATTIMNSVALSPDGTKVAFLQDSVAIPGGMDLFVAPTTANATAVKLSPDRPGAAATPANLDVFFQFEWSADSKFIAFSADLTEDKFDQGYVVDTTANTPVAVEVLTRADIATQTSGAQGIRGKLLFDADNNIYFRARVTTDNNSTFKFFKATTAGTKTEIAAPARTDNSAPDIGAFGITPDGHTVVFSADSPTANAYNLFKQAL